MVTLSFPHYIKIKTFIVHHVLRLSNTVAFVVINICWLFLQGGFYFWPVCVGTAAFFLFYNNISLMTYEDVANKSSAVSNFVAMTNLMNLKSL